MTKLEFIISLAGILLGSTALFGFIQYMITRKDNSNAFVKEIKSFMAKTEKDNVRTQMLVLMSSYPDDEAELLKLAEHYFVDLKGDWYMTTLFNKHCEKYKIARPAWFNVNE